MLKALGLIETRSLIGAIAAADSMLKNTNIAIVGKEHLSSGEVILIIEGEVSSVNLALEIGCEKSRELGQLKLSYIISKPEAELENLFGNLFGLKAKLENKVEKPEDAKVLKEKADRSAVKQIIKVDQEKKEEKPVVEKKSSDNLKDKKVKIKKEKTPVYQENFSLFDQPSDTIARLRREAFLHDQESDDPSVKEKKDSSDNHSAAVVEVITESKNETVNENRPALNDNKELSELNVHQLRRLARSTEGFPIKGREISRANRNDLIRHFNKL